VTDLARDDPTGRVLDRVDRGTDRIALHRYPAVNDPVAPAVVVWPTMGVPARYYRPFARELVGAGLAVVVADLRGTGDSTPVPSRRSRYGLAELVEDVGAVQQAIRSTVDARRTLLVATRSADKPPCSTARCRRHPQWTVWYWSGSVCRTSARTRAAAGEACWR
jgi:hypothetical protein